MNTPFLLYQLQKIDSKLSANEHRLSEISKLLTTDPDLIAAQKFHAATKFELDVAKDSLTKQEKRFRRGVINLNNQNHPYMAEKSRAPKSFKTCKRKLHRSSLLLLQWKMKN